MGSCRDVASDSLLKLSNNFRFVPGNVAAKVAACQQAAFCSDLATVQWSGPRPGT